MAGCDPVADLDGDRSVDVGPPDRRSPRRASDRNARQDRPAADDAPPGCEYPPIAELAVETVGGSAAWVVSFDDGGSRAAALSTGEWLAPPDRAAAIGAARAHLKHPAAVTSISRTSADAPPIDLRRARPAWRVVFADGIRVHIDADTGGVLALRTRQWRLFDFMWGLHILAPRGREDSSHAFLIIAAALSIVAVVAGITLLPFRRRNAVPKR